MPAPGWKASVAGTRHHMASHKGKQRTLGRPSTGQRKGARWDTGKIFQKPIAWGPDDRWRVVHQRKHAIHWKISNQAYSEPKRSHGWILDALAKTDPSLNDGGHDWRSRLGEAASTGCTTWEFHQKLESPGRSFFNHAAPSPGRKEISKIALFS